MRAISKNPVNHLNEDTSIPTRGERKTREMSVEKAITTMRLLIPLKLEVQQLSNRSQEVLDKVGSLFTGCEIGADDASKLEEGMSELQKLAELRKRYTLAVEKARPAYELLKGLGNTNALPSIEVEDKSDSTTAPDETPG